MSASAPFSGTAFSDSARRLSVDDLPGPGGWPVLGNLPQMPPAAMHRRFDSWADEFGPIYRLNVAGKRVVVVSDPDLNKEILRNRPGGFRRQSSIESIMDEMGSNGLFSLEGEAWRRRRKLAMPAFNASHLRGFHPTLEAITERLRKRWERQAPDDIRAELTRYTVDVTAKLTFDYDINTIEQSGDVIQRHLELIFPTLNRRLGIPIPYWRYVKLPQDRALDRALAALREDLTGVIARARANLPERPTNFIEALLLAQDRQESFTDDELFAEALTILIAGQDTTSNATAWLLYHLAGNPAVQERIRAEIAEIPSVLDRQPYLEAVAAESMRLQPTTPLLAMEAVQDTEIGGVRVPAGTWVIVNVQHAGVQDRNFSDPLAFDPERWLGGGHGNHRPDASIPFGSGPRFCPGRGLAMLEIKSVASMVCRTFDLGLPADAEPPTDQFHFAVIPIGMRLDLQRRRA
ncbi:cytochrome P450 [Nocardia huaxiensis]|uniref:Cytochrome P450 n=1 Tax=Nocardia huaxiensis TaxID=2755382 RepID=A0A7D6ZI50_9NOCA|nr:cytochrome P450 [Nocardia huaxiensis]QLY30320.1 cytochrome P450 [Nocardia huaxiensis]